MADNKQGTSTEAVILSLEDRLQGRGSKASAEKPCPRCKTPAVDKYHPFCSKRCADLDLGSWLKEDYRIATEEETDLDAYPDEDY